MRKLTRDDILKGKHERETLQVDQYGAEVVIRPLSDGELCEVLGVIGAIPLRDDGMPDVARIDPTKNFEALRLAVAKGMVEPQLTPEEISEMKFGVPEFIGTRILELSGIVTEPEVKKKGLKS
jgi:hypothetical protein